ncbi:MAG: hypothetical protein V3W44_10895 [Dehalococcoidales bacterium]
MKTLTFNAEMKAAYLAGRKSMTRRPVEQLTPDWIRGQDFDIEGDPPRIIIHHHGNSFAETIECPYGLIGDPIALVDTLGDVFARERITSLHLEQVRDITDEGADAEGLNPLYWGLYTSSGRFHILWDSIYADKGLGWAENPWVWVFGFTVTGG